MSDELTMVAMLAIAAGAAFFVAWPLMFGITCPEDFLEIEPAAAPRLRQPAAPRALITKAEERLEFEVDAPPRPRPEREGRFKPRADLDVELEIEAFRRHSQQEKQ